ncbi:collagen alpha-6(VI) chain-like [Physella acuta]|uniref:collagen alpha-6(VI) chain-like n=1 Tax=Physella acuta TaxID=109671 RepID=UPI0027DCCC3C|nr:collagen alpha-6(VI) chain-like [Physella acuta]
MPDATSPTVPYLTTPTVPYTITLTVPCPTTPTVPYATTFTVPNDTTPTMSYATTFTVPCPTTPTMSYATTFTVPNDTTPTMSYATTFTVPCPTTPTMSYATTFTVPNDTTPTMSYATTFTVPNDTILTVPNATTPTMSYATTPTVHCATQSIMPFDQPQPLTCPANNLIDTVFVLQNFYNPAADKWNRQVQFVVDVIGRFKLGVGNARFGVVTYSNYVANLLDLWGQTDMASINQTIKARTDLNLKDYTDKAFSAIKNSNMFGSSVANREKARRNLVLVTDGKSYALQLTVNLADSLKKSGIRILTVCLGTTCPYDEMSKISSSYADILLVSYFEQLVGVRNDLVDKLCTDPSAAPSTAAVPTTPKSNLQASLLPLRCPRQQQVDVIFVLHYSDNGGDKVNKMVQLVVNTVNAFYLGPNDARFGVVSNKQNVYALKDFRNFTDSAAVEKELKGNSDFKPGDSLDKPLNAVGQWQMFGDKLANRQGAKKFLVVITDKKSASLSDTLKAADAIKKQNVSILTVGVGDGVLTSELNAIASSVDDVILSSTVDLLSNLKNKLVNRLCKVSTAETGKKADVILVTDTSGNVNGAAYLWQQGILALLTQNFTLGPNDFRFGAVSFSDDARKEFDLNTYSNNSLLYQAIRDIMLIHSGSYLTKAYDLIVKEDMFSSTRGGRDFTNKFVVTITGGQVQDPDAAAQSANVLRSKGYTLVNFAWGIYNSQNITNIAGDESNTYKSIRVDLLQPLVVPIAKRLRGATPIYKCPFYIGLDVVFVLDSSANMGSANWTKLKQFVADVVSQVTIGPNDFSVGLLTYGDAPQKAFDLNTYSDATLISQAVNGLAFKSGATVTHKALSAVVELNLFSSNVGGRSNAADVVVLVTNGRSSSQSDAVKSADVLKKQGVKIITLGVGGKALFDEMNALASTADVILVDSFDLAWYTESYLVERVCKVDQPQPLTCPANNLIDTVFVLENFYNPAADKWNRQVQFVVDVIGRFKLGVGNARFGVVTYSNYVANLLDLWGQTDMASINQTIKARTDLNLKDYTDKAFSAIKNSNMFGSTVANREKARRNLVLVTDGKSYALQLTVNLADSLKKSGIRILSVCLGTTCPYVEMSKISSSYADILLVSYFEQLVGVRNDLVDKLCTASLLPLRCPRQQQVDVIFILNYSDNGGDKVNKIIQLVVNTTSKFYLGPNDARFGVVSNQQNVYKLVDFRNYTDSAAIEKDLKGNPYLKAGDLLDKPLNAVGQWQMFGDKLANRQGAKKFLVVITDKKSASLSDTLKAADVIKKQNVSILTVGVGDGVLTSELNAIASSVDDVIVSSTVDMLSNLKNKLVNRLCKVSTAETGKKADVILVTDSSGNVNGAAYLWQQGILALLTQNFTLGPNDFRFGAVSFSDDARKEFDLNTYSNNSLLYQAIREIMLIHSGSYLAKAYDLIVKEDMFSSARGGRDFTNKFVVTITGGQVQDPDAAAQSANILRSKGYTLVNFAWGIYNSQNITNIAGDESNTYKSIRVDLLQPLVVPMAKRLRGATPIYKCPFNVGLDVVFILDSSANMGSANWTKLKQFVADVVSQVTIGPNDFSVGLLTYGDAPQKAFDLNTYSDASLISQAVNGLAFKSGATVTHKALSAVVDLNLFSSNVGGRSNAADVVVLVTNGRSSSQSDAVKSADVFKKQGVKIITLGVGGKTLFDEMNALASTADDVILVDSFDLATSWYTESYLVERVCKASTAVK